MNLPTVSVIVPVYNAEESIEKCVKSILDNGYQALELILVNDGSLDNSGSICDKLANDDSRIKVFHKENGGVGAARNDGISLATGKYLAFVDADDTVSKDMYEKMVGTAEKYSADCVVCSIVNIYPSYEHKESHIFGNQIIAGHADVHQRIVVPLITPGHTDASLMQSPCNKLYRNSLVQKHELKFSHLPYAEDWLFNIEFFMNSAVVAFVNEFFYFYDRKTEGSLSKSWRKDSFQNTVWIQNKLAQLFPERYSHEDLDIGILGIQVECLRNYVYYCGTLGFFAYASQLFSNKELVSAYQKITQIPNQYRYPQKCIQQGWPKRYCLWCLYRVKINIIKRGIRIVLKK